MGDVTQLLRDEPFSRLIGIETEVAADGYSRCSVVITEQLLNFVGTGHGAVVLALADVAFGGVSCGTHMPSVGINLSASFMQAARVGDRLVAEARLVHQTRRLSHCAIEVTCGDRVIATLTGTAYKLAEPAAGHQPGDAR